MPVRPPLIFIAPFVIGLAVQWVYPLAGPPRWTRILLGALCVLPAIALYVAAQVTLYRARTTIDPDGRPRVLVATGPFRRSRNPLYLALLLLYAGVALGMGVLWSLALLPALAVWVHYGAVRQEENRLSRLFDKKYARYCQTVPRWWHLPRLGHGIGEQK
jgi:protein-S-isoprenylcysteine O-methyltransferase Ste14